MPGRAHREYAFTEGGFALEEEPAFERAPFPYDLKTALQHDRPALVGKAIAVRDREWTYVWRRHEGPELYHRGSDPDERINLADSAGHAGTRQRLHDAIFTWLADTADVLPADADPRSPQVDLPAPGEGPPSGSVERYRRWPPRIVARRPSAQMPPGAAGSGRFADNEPQGVGPWTGGAAFTVDCGDDVPYGVAGEDRRVHGDGGQRRIR
jgi:hypothetical protein